MVASQHSRQDLLERLGEMFTRYGYEGASMSRIAAATGLGKASLYHHFPGGKEEMAREVVRHVRHWFEEAVFKPLETLAPPRQRIDNMMVTLAQQYEGGARACLPALFALTEDRAMFGGELADLFARWLACLVQTLADAGLARDIAERRAGEGLARVVGALALVRCLGDARPFQAAQAELASQLLAGADRSNIWSSRAPRFPVAPPIGPAAAVPPLRATSLAR